MSYFESIFKQRVKEVIKQMVKDGEIIIDENEIFVIDIEEQKKDN